MSSTKLTGLKALPKDPLTKLESCKPTPQALHQLRKEIYANARSIEWEGAIAHTHGHLGLVMPVAAFQLLSGTAFVMPVKPDIPQYTNTASREEGQELKEEYHMQMQAHYTATNLEAYLKTLLLAAVPELYIAILEDDTHGFDSVTTRELLEHLITEYGAIEAEHLHENLQALEADWNPDTEIEAVFLNAKQCRQFAATEDPISDQAYVAALIRVFRKSQVFTFALQDWDLKPKAATGTEHTVDNLHKHFLAADKARTWDKNNALTMKGALGANAATGTDITYGCHLKGHRCPSLLLDPRPHVLPPFGQPQRYIQSCSNPANRRPHQDRHLLINPQGTTCKEATTGSTASKGRKQSLSLASLEPSVSKKKKAERIKEVVSTTLDARVAKAYAQELINKENSQTGVPTSESEGRLAIVAMLMFVRHFKYNMRC